ncbi:alginate O-acetylation protein [Geobacter sp. AOG2]|nr:alginate O-acetylation protein [Geobacter sp. AOG2]
MLLLLYYIVANYLFGLSAEKYRDSFWGKVVVWLSIAMNLLPLICYRYPGVAAMAAQGIIPSSTGVNIADYFKFSYLPLGLSFLTFQAIAYVLDVYRDEIDAQKNPLLLSLFLVLFPKITAGPIIRYSEVAEDLADPKVSADKFAMGARRFVIGLGKKVLLADTLALTANQIFSVPAAELSPSAAWLGLITYSLQLYLDFSGYSDMAIGLGRMFGFTFQENFNYPYISRSLTEFWRRWHISLSTWLRDYMFIPLSYALMSDSVRQKIAQGRYPTNYRSLFSIVMVFTACGLWHGVGWNFIVWGMLHGVVLALESLWLSRVIKKWWVPLQHVYLLLIVMLPWVFFRASSFSEAVDYLRTLAGFPATTVFHYDLRMYIDSTELLVLIAGVVASTPIVRNISDHLRKTEHHAIGAFCEIAGMVFVLMLSFCSIASSTFTPFLYQKF